MSQISAASKLLVKLSQRLFADAESQHQFIDALIHPQTYASAILWINGRPDLQLFPIESPVSWQPTFVDRISPAEKPGQHPLHKQGHFYCLDLSSVFTISVLLQVQEPVNTVIDVCAAPGGKSIFSWVALQPHCLLSNEVIGKRMGALISNLKRCQIRGAIALSLDSSILATELSQTAEVVIVDAPCTGQSLLAKGDKAPGCFHPVTINKNANRQKRILANAAQLVAPQGYLAYMTCAYSLEENEQVCGWFLERFPQFQPLPVAPLQAYQSDLSELPCYRLFPQSGLGAGGFTMLLQNQARGASTPLPTDFLTRSQRYHIP